jgi:RND family efflux transporter MFP subunit
MNRILFPLIGILVAVVVVIQIRAARSETVPATPAKTAVETARVVAEGRVSAYPGGEVTIGSDVAGRIDRIAVEEQQTVRKGDLIALVNADDTRAALAEAEARVGELEADIRLFEVERARAKGLFDAEVGSRQAWDKSVRDVEAAEARRKSALAEVSRLRAILAKTRITSPIDGVVITRHVDRGETIVEGDRLVTVANLDRLRVEAEVDEFDVARVRLGAPVRITAEGYSETWRGTVEEIPSSVTSRRLNPPDPSKPIDTRVLMAKIALVERAPLKLGQRVEVAFE